MASPCFILKPVERVVQDDNMNEIWLVNQNILTVAEDHLARTIMIVRHLHTVHAHQLQRYTEASGRSFVQRGLAIELKSLS
jgi:hypothetical protein